MSEISINASPAPDGVVRQLLPALQYHQAPSPQREIRVVIDDVPMLDTARFEHMQRLASMMAECSLIPDALRTTKGENGAIIDLPQKAVLANCFMIVNQAVRWRMDPFAVAQCVGIVHGRLVYEGKLVAAVLDANLGVRLNYTFDDKPGDQLGIRVFGTRPGETTLREITGIVAQWHKGQKSPWANPADWKRQLRYRGAREWARAHAPGVMLGVVADDEAEDFRSDRRLASAKPVTIIGDDIPEEHEDRRPVVAATGLAAPMGDDIPDEDAPIVDPERFLDHLRSEYRLCQSEAEANELRENNADILRRLQPAHRKTAYAILDGEEV